MNTDIVSIDAFTIEELPGKNIITLIDEPEAPLPETSLPVIRRFGIVDLWKIRSKKRHFTFYR